MKRATVVHVIALVCCLQASILQAVDVVVTSNADSGVGTLREAIDLANSGDVIVFDIPVATPTISLATPLPQLTGDLSFRNEGAASVVIDRNGTAAWEFNGGTIDPTGLTLVDGGAPSAAADIVATSATTLFGNAAFEGNLTTPGTIAPGPTALVGDTGTFQVVGNLDATNATIALDIDSAGPTQTDLISVSGNATFTDAELMPTFAGELFASGQDFIVFDTGSATGAFSNAGDVYALPNQPFLEAVQNVALPANQFGFLIQDNGVSFGSVVTGVNQTSASTMLDELLGLGTVPAVSTLRNGTAETVQLAVDQLSGSIYPSLIGAEIHHIQTNVASIRDRVAMHEIGCQPVRRVVWARGYGASGKVSRDTSETVGYHQVIGGVELGTGLRTSSGLAFYAFGQLADAQVETREVEQRANVKSYRVGGMVEYRLASYYAIAAGGGGTQTYDVRRSLDAFAGSTMAESTFDGKSQFGYIELGKFVQQQCAAWGPYLGLHASRVELDPIAETGDANFALTTDAGYTESYRSILGWSYSQSAHTPCGFATTRLHTGWMHEFGNQFAVFQSQLAASNTSALVDRGVAVGRDWGFVRLQVDVGEFLGGQLTTSYLGQYNGRSSLNTGLAGLQWAF